MKFKRKIASLLAFLMVFSAIATFSVNATPAVAQAEITRLQTQITTIESWLSPGGLFGAPFAGSDLPDIPQRDALRAEVVAAQAAIAATLLLFDPWHPEYDLLNDLADDLDAIWDPAGPTGLLLAPETGAVVANWNAVRTAWQAARNETLDILGTFAAGSAPQVALNPAMAALNPPTTGTFPATPGIAGLLTSAFSAPATPPALATTQTAINNVRVALAASATAIGGITHADAPTAAALVTGVVTDLLTIWDPAGPGGLLNAPVTLADWDAARTILIAGAPAAFDIIEDLEDAIAYLNGIIADLAPDAAAAAARTGRPIQGHITNAGTQFTIGHVNFRWYLFDRGLTQGFQPPGLGIAPNAVERVVHSPEVIVPISMLSPAGGTLEFELTGWGDAPWAFGQRIGILPGATTRSYVGTSDVAADPRLVLPVYSGGTVGWTGLINFTDLPYAEDAGFFTNQFTGATELRTYAEVGANFANFSPFSRATFFYSGMQMHSSVGTSPVRNNELPLMIQVVGTRLYVSYPAFGGGGFPSNTILRLPVIATPTTAATINATPILTLERGLTLQPGQYLPARQLPIVVGGAGVTASIANVVSGRNFVNMSRLTIAEPTNSRGAMINGGQIHLDLPWGYRWSHTQATVNADLTLLGLALGGTASVPSFDPDGISRDGIAALSRITINLPDPLPRPYAVIAGNMTIDGLRIISAGGLLEPMFGDVNLTITTGGRHSNEHGVGHANFVPTPATGSNYNQAFVSVAPSTLHVATFADHAMTFNHVSSAAGGDVTTIVAGRLPQHGGPAGTLLINNARHSANSAGVVLSEVVPNSGWFAQGVTFTLVDAAGVPLTDASITNVHLTTTPVGRAATPAANTQPAHWANGRFFNRTGDNGANNVLVAGSHAGGAHFPLGTTAVSDVVFHQNGGSVTVRGLHLTQEQIAAGNTISLTAHFGITTDVSFTGAVYVAVEGVTLAAGALVGDIHNPRLQIANVRSGVTVETGGTTLPIGFYMLNVMDVTLRETEVGDFRPGQIRLSLGQYGLGRLVTEFDDMVFVPFNPAAIARGEHFSIGGAPNVHHRVMANLQPSHAASSDIFINVTRVTQAGANTTPSYMTVSGLMVRANRSVPEGHYELIVRGPGIAENERFWHNITSAFNAAALPNPATGTTTQHINVNPYVPTTAANRFLQPNSPGFRRYAHGPLMYERYITVGTPGLGANLLATARVSVPHAPGNTFTVNGTSRNFTNAGGTVITSMNVDGRLFVPLRAITEAFGATINPIFNDNLTVRSVVVEIGGIAAEFFIGSTTFTVNGVSRSMMTAGIPTRPFIATEGANAGTTYLPIRYIAEAFNLQLASDINGNAVINPTAAEWANYQAGTPVATVEENNGNGNNGNGNNGNGND